jgi:hypothetical protein
MLKRPGSAAGGDEVAGGAAVWAEAILTPKSSSARPATIAFLTVFLHVECRRAAQRRASEDSTPGAHVTLLVVSTAVGQKPRRPSDLDDAETSSQI